MVCRHSEGLTIHEAARLARVQTLFNLLRDVMPGTDRETKAAIATASILASPPKDDVPSTRKSPDDVPGLPWTCTFPMNRPAKPSVALKERP